MKVLDYTGTSHLVSKTKTELAKKVDKVTGKGLSTNDYTNAEKQKVADSLTDAPSDGKQYARQDGDWEELDLDGKANIDGYYDTLSVGLADNLIDRKGNGTPQEISYRTSCGDDSIADDGNGIIQSIFGKTVVWNELIKNSMNYQTYSAYGLTITKTGDIYVLNGTATQDAYFALDSTTEKVVANHKYYVRGCPNGGSNNKYVLVDAWNGYYRELGEGVIFTPSTGNSCQDAMFVKNGVTVENIVYSKPIRVDLTQLFGSGNEPTTVDDPRIEWIKQYANDHPEYNSGELISYNGSGIKTVGFNLFDENAIMIQHGFTKQSDGSFYMSNPNTGYGKVLWKNEIGYTGQIAVTYDVKYLNNTVQSIGLFPVAVYTDGTTSSFPKPYSTAWGNGTFVTAQGKVVDEIRWSYASGSCQSWFKNININLSWSGYRNGEYEPYWSRTLALPISTYFPDGMKSAGSVRDEMTKDKAVKRIGKVDLGSLDWTKSTSVNLPRFYAKVSDIKNVSNWNAVGFECAEYKKGNVFNPTTSMIGVNTNNVYICDENKTNMDATEFKTAMSGVYLYFELAEPIETTITPPLDLTYKVADFGTEESIAEGKSTPFNGIIKYSDDFTRGLVNMPKNYDTTASLDALATSLSTMLTSALDGTVTITRGAYDSTNKKYAWNCTFTPNA